MGVGGQRHGPAALTWEGDPVPLYWKLGGSHGWSVYYGRFFKKLSYKD